MVVDVSSLSNYGNLLDGVSSTSKNLPAIAPQYNTGISPFNPNMNFKGVQTPTFAPRPMTSMKIASLAGWGLLGSVALDGFVNYAKNQYVDKGLANLDENGNLIPRPSPVKPKSDYFTPPSTTDDSGGLVPPSDSEDFNLKPFEGSNLLDALNGSAAASLSSAQSLNAIANNMYYDWEHKQAQHKEQQANYRAYNEGIIIALAEISAHLSTIANKDIIVNVPPPNVPVNVDSYVSPVINVPESPVNVSNVVNVPESPVNVSNIVNVPESSVNVSNVVNVPESPVTVNVDNDIKAEFVRSDDEIALTALQLENQENYNALTEAKLEKTLFEITPVAYSNFEDMPELAPVAMKAVNDAVTAMKHSHENLFEFDGADIDLLFSADMPDISKIFEINSKTSRLSSIPTGGV